MTRKSKSNNRESNGKKSFSASKSKSKHNDSSVHKERLPTGQTALEYDDSHDDPSYGFNDPLDHSRDQTSIDDPKMVNRLTKQIEARNSYHPHAMEHEDMEFVCEPPVQLISVT